MLYSKRERLEDRVVAIANAAPITVKALWNRLAAEGEAVSLRAVYKTVDYLLEAGVLVKAGKRVRVDGEWVRNLSAKLAPPLSAPLGAGERAAYTFTSIEHLDAFWKTIVLQLETHEKDGQVFFYNPHNFWAYVSERRESEDAYYRHFDEAGVHAYFTIGGDTEGDMEWKRSYQTEFLQIDTRPIASFPRNMHLTVMGDFIVSVRLPKAMARRIDEVYEAGGTMAQMLPKITAAYRAPGNIRFVIEHNPARAGKLRRSLALNFYFKKPAA